MSREVHVRFCEGVGVRFPRATRRNVYVRSERAGKRVMASVTRFIESRLRLKVNSEKSAVARPQDRHFVGFQLGRKDDGSVYVQLSARSRRRAFDRIKELTPRTWGNSVDDCIGQLNQYLRGWLNFFGICTRAESWTFSNLDSHIRRRLRAILIRQTKRKRHLVRRLIRLGAPRSRARRIGHGGSWWALSNCEVVRTTFGNAYFASRGLFSLVDNWQHNQPRKQHQRPPKGRKARAGG